MGYKGFTKRLPLEGKLAAEPTDEVFSLILSMLYNANLL